MEEIIDISIPASIYVGEEEIPDGVKYIKDGDYYAINIDLIRKSIDDGETVTIIPKTKKGEMI